jgi:hypothetical protein
MTSIGVRRREPDQGSRGAEYRQSSTGALEHEIEAIVDRRVDARLRALGVVVVSTEYTSNPGNPSLPPELPQDHRGRRTLNRWCRLGLVEGASPDGQGWRCGVPEWRAARAATKRLPKPAPAPTSDEAEALLMAKGLRR